MTELKITQADRDAACKLFDLPARADIVEMPGGPSILEAFARHRIAAEEGKAELVECLEGMLLRHEASRQNWTQAVMDAQKSGDYELSCSLRNTALQALEDFPIDAARAALARVRGEG